MRATNNYAEPKDIRLDPLETRIYEAILQRPQDVRSLQESAAGASPERVSAIVARFDELKIAHAIGSKMLALATADFRQIRAYAQAA